MLIGALQNHSRLEQPHPFSNPLPTALCVWHRRRTPRCKHAAGYPYIHIQHSKPTRQRAAPGCHALQSTRTFCSRFRSHFMTFLCWTSSECTVTYHVDACACCSLRVRKKECRSTAVLHAVALALENERGGWPASSTSASNVIARPLSCSSLAVVCQLNLRTHTPAHCVRTGKFMASSAVFPVSCLCLHCECCCTAMVAGATLRRRC